MFSGQRKIYPKLFSFDGGPDYTMMFALHIGRLGRIGRSGPANSTSPSALSTHGLNGPKALRGQKIGADSLGPSTFAKV